MRLHKIYPETRERMERIFAYINGKLNAISAEEQIVLERCNFADNLLRSRHTDNAVVDLIRQKFEVSKSTAYNDLVTTKYLFNSLSIEDKSYGLKLLLDINMKCLDKAILNTELKIARELMETRIKLLDKIEDSIDPHDSKSGPTVYIMQVSTSSTGRKRMIDLQTDVKELSEDEIDMIQENVNKAHLPKDIVKFLQR
jgi:hypothetical protein